MNVLITGGAGFIGSHLAEACQAWADVVVLDDLSTGSRENLAGVDCRLIEGSITDPERVQEAMEGIDYVFHLAARTSVPESMTSPRAYVETNTLGTLHLLEAAAAAKVKKFCFSSSAAVYGDSPALPKHEEMTPDPKSPYAVTKLDGEYYCRIFTEEKRLHTVALRYFNVYGPRQDPDSAYAAAVPIFLERARNNEPITIFGDGQQTRDFIHVSDVIAANILLARNPRAAGVYNVACGQSTTITTLAEMIVNVTGSTSEIRYAPPRMGDICHSCAATERIGSHGYTPRKNLREGLEQTLNFIDYPAGQTS